MFVANHSSHEYGPIHKINFDAAHAVAMLGVTNSREKTRRAAGICSAARRVCAGHPLAAANRFPASSTGHGFMGTGMSGACVEIPVDISSRFNVLGYPNGGYITRLAAETLAGRSAHPDLLSINASFLGHPVSGPATARIVELGSTKSLSRATLSLMQGGDLKAFYVATFTDFSRTTGASASHCAGPQLPVTPYHACVSIDTLAIPDPMRSFISQFNLRLAPGVLQDSGPEHAATIEGWISLDDEVSSTLASLALFADGFPPPIYNLIDRAKWQSVPTIEYAVHVKANPGPGPIHARFVTKEVRNGLLVIDGELRDMDGQRVAESRQLAEFRGTFGTPSRAS
ncbi:thioesterase family protein [Burkholderia lata]|uniref:thioesterase family protein n=1 Tax=Burkholderia lata (strain ATCC 17760 / DSM 23089 / LMG 22485 / NCIMB 9086 / R18194 / 383) TaxID=482957 RepID=UPI0015825A25|nr:thioesterase family protein [Burkholderia lata]